MALDLAALTSTPDIRCIPHVQARLVCAWRYVHIARRCGNYSHHHLLRYLCSIEAIKPFHVFSDTIGRAWPEPFVLNPPCQPLCSYDEMLMLDLTTAAAKDDRKAFDAFIVDMVPEKPRDAIWHSARGLMGPRVTPTENREG
ncbi:MAG: hypothetical protein KDE55_17475 [Novosphingobium sp.]|nr:hypothetical protein [Novosphingobium sp.]